MIIKHFNSTKLFCIYLCSDMYFRWLFVCSNFAHAKLFFATYTNQLQYSFPLFAFFQPSMQYVFTHKQNEFIIYAKNVLKKFTDYSTLYFYILQIG